jgi:hypothetical protein
MTTKKPSQGSCIDAYKAEVAKLPVEQAVLRSHAIVEEWIAGGPELANLRRAALRRALHDGWTQADLAHLLGVSRQRIHQLLDGEQPTPRRKAAK